MKELNVSKRAGLLAGLAMTLWASTSAAGILRVQDDALAPLGAADDGFNITVDTDHGLEWLDWTMTAGYSIPMVEIGLLGPGGLLHGWRLATALEFAGLGAAAGVPLPYLDKMVLGDAPVELVELALALGITQPRDSSTFAAFGEIGTGGPGTVRLGGLTLAYEDTRLLAPPAAIFDIPNDPELWVDQNWPETMRYPAVGVALVRQAATVPAPLTGALLLIGLLGIGAARRRFGSASAC